MIILQMFQETDVDDDEMQCILANLIYEVSDVSIDTLCYQQCYEVFEIHIFMYLVFY